MPHRSSSRKASRRPAKGRTRRYHWEKFDTSELLEVRLRDLKVELPGTWLEQMIDELSDELARREIRFRPHFWISDDWMVPAGATGIAIPFYLTHPRLMRLERRQMFQVEGGTPVECKKILRHEAGHAIQNAYRLQRRKRWQQLFGLSSSRYPDFYRPNPASRRFVQHLDSWYAQSHPDEDFAETFAVWLQPRSGWRRKYHGWPALRKLEYVDELMAEICKQPPRHRSRARPFSLPQLHRTLREHYQDKREHYGVEGSNIYDADLQRLFSADVNSPRAESAATFLRRNRRELRKLVCRWTGEHEFTVDQVLKELIHRCVLLRLHAEESEKLKADLSIVLTIHTMNLLYHRRDWHAL